MAHWEFLIQREDDRSWLPLEAKEVEILEGRYRLAARSGYPNTPIKIHIVYQPEHSSSPKPLSQRRSGRTNQSGLILIFPFSQLKPGTLSLNCMVAPGDQVVDRHDVKLQILEKGLEASEVWETDWQEETIILPPKPKSTSHSNSNSESQALSSNDSELSFGKTIAEPTVSSPLNPVEQSLLLLDARLVLNQEAFVASEGQPIQLLGTANLTFDRPHASDLKNEDWQGKLKISLREPQSLQTIANVWYSLAVETSNNQPNVPFSCEIQIPSGSKTHLLLGEINLYPAQAVLDTKAVPLASHAFTVTAEVGDLLETLANLREALPDESGEQVNQSGTGTSEVMGQGAATATGGSSPLLRLVQLTDIDDRSAKELPNLSQAKGLLPPQIYQPNPDEVAAMKVQLPKLPKPSPELDTPQTGQDIATVDDDRPDDLWQATEEIVVSSSHSNHLSVDEAVSTELEDISQPEAQESLAEQSGLDLVVENLSGEMVQAEVDPDLESIDFQERFWTKLSNLADDEELSDWLGQDIEEELGNTPAVAASSSTVELIPLPEQFSLGNGQTNYVSTAPLNFAGFEITGEEFEDAWLAHEVVVDEDFGLPAHVTPAVRLPLVSLLSEDEPIPIPDLDLVGGELISGDPLPICVTIPNLPSRIYVKLWISDRQTRTLLEGPRWLTDFRPDGFGNLESTIQLAVPFGSLEIQIAAVAVETHSQRESHKVTVDRSIVPPDLPNFSLDELDL